MADSSSIPTEGPAGDPIPARGQDPVPARVRDRVDVRPHPTVVRLDDLEKSGTEWITEAYHLTGDVRTHLGSLETILTRPTGTGLFLIGPYGCGKSHLLAYLARRLSAGRALVGDGPLAGPGEALRPPTPITISLLNFPSSISLEDIVRERLGIDEKTSRGDRRRGFDALADGHPDGLFLIIDELSEFLRSKPDSRTFHEDVRYLQFLGELASDRRLFVLAAMQESIEHTGELERDLYRKIKDRYPIRYLLSPAHVRDLVADSLLVKKPGYDEAVRQLLVEARAALPDAPIDPEAFAAIYPIHPATLELLEEVRDAFSQARGAVDFVITQLAGDAARGVEPFLDRPWGSLVCPDRIVSHFRELFEFQPEFIALAQRFLPWYRRHLEELFDRPALRELASRLLDLLVLVHLSPARKQLRPEEAAYWLLYRVTRIDPDRNRRIVEKVLSTLVEKGRWVVERDGSFLLDLEDDGVQAFDRRVDGEKAELREWGDGVFELVAPLLGDADLNPLSLPRDEWQVRRVRWHFHERPFRVWVGNGDPSVVKDTALCIRLPWSEPAPADGVPTLVPRSLTVGEETLELAALMRLRERGVSATVLPRLERRLQERLDLLRVQIRSAYDDARIALAGGTWERPPRVEPGTPLGVWLERNGQWLLRRRFPAFEDFAPRHGVLPEEAYRRFVRFALAEGLLAPDAGELPETIREGYLEPLGLLVRKGRHWSLPARPDKHELVERVLSRAALGCAPREIADELGRPAWGLVEDQVRVLLVFLSLIGEIDIVDARGQPYRAVFETDVDPLHFEKVILAESLSADAQRDLETLADGLGIKRTKETSLVATKRLIGKLRELAERERARLERPLAHLARLRLEQPDAGGSTLASQLSDVAETWKCLLTGASSGDRALDEVEAFERFRETIGDARAFLVRLAALGDLPERFERLVADQERLAHLLSHAALEGCPVGRVRREAGELGRPPTLDEPDRLESWLSEAREFWARYKEEYARQHESFWKECRAREIWDWRPDAAAASRHLGLTRELERFATLRAEAERARCAALGNLDFQAICGCGFDWKGAPIEPKLDELERLARSIDGALDAFFGRREVREKVADWAAKGLDDTPLTRAYLSGEEARPSVADLTLLDRHLAGVEILREVELDDLLERFGGTSWDPAELARELKSYLAELGVERVRLVRAATDTRSATESAVRSGEGAARRAERDERSGETS